MRINRAQFSTLILLASLTFSGAVPAWAQVETRDVTMKVEGKKYLMELYKPSNTPETKRPGVLLVPDYWGRDDLDDVQARRLANYGFVVLVVDLYGDDQHTTQNDVAERWVKEGETPDLQNMVDLIGKSLDVLKAQPEVDPKDIGGVGFGYGGGLLWNLAKAGGDPALKAIVSFYGGTKKVKPVAANSKSLPAILYLRPQYDLYTTDEDIKSFAKELKTARMDAQIVDVPGAYHGFIHKTIENYGTDMGKSFMYYDATAATQAWTKTQLFLNQKLLGSRVPNSIVKPKPANLPTPVKPQPHR